MKVNYAWLKDYVGDALPDTGKVTDLLTEHAFEIDGIETVGSHAVIDVDVLPNRSSDCLCHRGIARELATILDIDLKYDPFAVTPNLAPTDKIQVTIADTSACPRFTAALITGIEVKESPGWLKERLESLGQRSINNVVDATNYVMFAIGQPLHAYDADLFSMVDGKWQFGVRFAKVGEIVEILPEGGSSEPRQVECVGTELLIVDESSNTPIGLAGVKGGQYAGVHAGTANIIIEAANFHPTITRKTARRLGIVIDASKRFENEPSRDLPPYGQYKIIKLIEDIAGGTYEGTLDVYPEPKENLAVSVRVSKTNALLGLELSQAEIAAIITRTGSTVTEAEPGVLSCTGPWERTDLLIEEDFIEEVGRLHGLLNIVSVVPEKAAPGAVNVRQYYSEQIRQVLLAQGFSEVITSSFQKKDTIQLQNALASDKSYVRSGLRKNITAALDANFAHTDLLGIRAVKVFEIGTVFGKTESGVGEHLSLAIGVRQKGNGYTPKDDAPLQAAITTLEAQLGVTLESTSEQGVAEVNLTNVFASLPVPATYDAIKERKVTTYTAVSPYPATARDIALWVPAEFESERVLAILQENAGSLCVRIDLFDQFEKDGRTSYAFRLVFQSSERTLTDGEVADIMDTINQVAEQNGWEVR
jgi:phenylalanyl-tRNA synthetase beta chain